MKKIFLMTPLLIGCFLPAYSQINNNLQDQFHFDTDYKSLMLKNKPMALPDSIGYSGFLNDPTTQKKYLTPKLFDDNYLSFEQNQINMNKTPQMFDNMPVLKPQGSFTMPIQKPDSTIEYTLLIKKIETAVGKGEYN